MNGVVTSAMLQTQRTAYQGIFNRALKGATAIGLALATVAASTTKYNTYGWLSALPKFRKWIGERRYQSVKEKAYRLENDKFSAELEIDLDDWEDDNLGQYNTLIETWGDQAGQLDDQLIFGALLAGHTKECWDGQNFFDTDHPYEYKDAAGVTQSGTYANMSGNDAVPPWFLVDLSQPLKPILLQRRKPPTFWMQTDVNSEYVQMHQKVPLHGTARAGVGYTLPQLAHRCTGPVTEANYLAAKKAMTDLKGEDGEPLGIRPTHMYVGASSEAAAKKLVEALLINGGESNTLYNDVKIVVCPRLS